MKVKSEKDKEALAAEFAAYAIAFLIVSVVFYGMSLVGLT